ncbi:Uncharacterised protein [Shigella sonnei]|nr:Uncharacterised protein [Shigella sonnei]
MACQAPGKPWQAYACLKYRRAAPAALVGSENGGDGDAFVREEREAMDVVLQALDGEHMS